MQRIVGAALIAIVLGLPGVAVAQEGGEGTETAIAVVNETEYRAALSTLSALNSGPHTITLTGNNIPIAGATDPTYSGTEDLVIEGGGFILSGEDNSRVLDVTGATPGEVTLRNITVEKGANDLLGGAVNSTGDVVFEDATVRDNHVDDFGPVDGAAVKAVNVTLTRATVTGNTAVANSSSSATGGAVSATGSVTITDSTLDGNSAMSTGTAWAASGGAVFAGGPVEVTRSTVTGNSAHKDGATIAAQHAQGGAIRAGGMVTVDDSTISGNTALAQTNNAEGGAVWTASGDVSITDSTVAANTADARTGPATGGAVRANSGTIIVERSTIHDNESKAGTQATGGALYTTGAKSISVTASLVTENSATAGASAAQGGAIVAPGAPTTITRSQVRGNTATSTSGGATGGAVYASGSAATVALVDSSLIANSTAGPTALSALGGAVYGAAAIAASNATFTANTAGQGGAIYNAGGDVDLAHATVSGNTGTTGTNLYVFDTLTAEASAVVNPIGPANCFVAGSTTTTGHNVESGTDCGFTDAAGGDVQNATTAQVALGPARNNGGAAVGDATEAVPAAAPTQSAFPLQGSILIDAIAPASCSAAPELDLDQRGVDRPFGAGCDVGATEAVFPPHGFSDVSPFYEATVRWITSVVNTPQILLGFANGTFGQDLNITRGQAARLYHRAAGAPPVGGLPQHGFSDVSAFFEDAVRWAKDQGIFLGFPDNTFRQNNPIVRGNFVRSLYGFAGAPDTTSFNPHGFSDVSPFYENAIKWAKHFGLANGFPNGTFGQGLNITRGNATRIPYNLAQTPTAWDDPNTAPANMLFRPNLT